MEKYKSVRPVGKLRVIESQGSDACFHQGGRVGCGSASACGRGPPRDAARGLACRAGGRATEPPREGACNITAAISRLLRSLPREGHCAPSRWIPGVPVRAWGVLKRFTGHPWKPPLSQPCASPAKWGLGAGRAAPHPRRLADTGVDLATWADARKQAVGLPW